MLVRIERLNYPLQSKKAATDALWRAAGCLGKDACEILVTKLHENPINIEIPQRNFSMDRVAEFTQLFDFSIVNVRDDMSSDDTTEVVSESSTLKLYTVTIRIAFNSLTPGRIYTSLILASDEAIAQDQVFFALDLEPDEAIYDISVVEIEGPFHDGQVLTLNSKK